MLILTLSTNSLSVGAGNTCEECLDTQKRSGQLEREQSRLSHLKTANETYLAEIDEEQSGQRIKILSNLHVIANRMTTNKQEQSSHQMIINLPKCKDCLQ